ncbi:MAG TPA: M48 family metalloprotease [Mycobacterium sp.]|nr:M48 family metalloprotease [Mycobacterium sp.]
MTIAAVLLLYVAAVLMIGPTVLVRITAGGSAPRLAITAWLTAIVTVIGCSIAVVALVLVEAAGHWDNPDELLASCLERLRVIALGHAGGVAQVVAIAAMAFIVASLIAVIMRLNRALSRMRSDTLAHADGVRLVGRPIGSDVVIIDAPAPAAYCVAGRPPAIVVTTAALTALDQSQLNAVIAHERAHLKGRHAYLVAAVRGLTTALPTIRLFDSAAMHVSSLLEMCADDAAARAYGRRPLLDGLLTLSGAGTPAHGLAAAAISVLARAQRLSDPPGSIARIRSCFVLCGAVVAMSATPGTITVLSLSGALICFA